MTLDHKIIWNQLNCHDLDQAIAFYGDLFDWQTKPEERETYVHFYSGDETVAGLAPLRGPKDAACNWAVHVGTSAIESLCARAQEAGGSLRTPIMDIPHTGKLCAMADPEGATLMAFQPEHPDRTSWGNRNQVGHFCWVELMCQDPSKSIEYYRQCVGWGTLNAPMAGGAYSMFVPPDAGGQGAIGGVMQMPKPDVPDHWLPYVMVEDVIERAERVKALGGEICVEPVAIPGHGHIAVLIDPQGAVLAMYQAQ